MTTVLADDPSGARLYAGAARPLLPALAELFERNGTFAGTRLYDSAALRALVADDAVSGLARRLLGADARPVRAILFDKQPGANWALGWHQDRVVAVRERIDVPGFGPWSVKRGVNHVAPP